MRFGAFRSRSRFAAFLAGLASYAGDAEAWAREHGRAVVTEPPAA